MVNLSSYCREPALRDVIEGSNCLMELKQGGTAEYSTGLRP